MAKRSNVSDVWKSCKRLDVGKHASCEICGEKCLLEAVQHLHSENTCVYGTRPLVAHAGTSGTSSKISGYFGKAPLPMNRQLEE